MIRPVNIDRCPFCGGEARIRRSGNASSYLEAACCNQSDCGAVGARASIWDLDIPDDHPDGETERMHAQAAADKWNRVARGAAMATLVGECARDVVADDRSTVERFVSLRGRVG